MTETRIVKIVMVGSLALFAGLVTFDNLIDYETNYAFVRHVLSMDTTLPGNALMHRSIASPSLWRAAYALIIAGEGRDGTRLCRRGDLSAAPFAFADRMLQSCQRIDGRGRLRAQNFWISSVAGFSVGDYRRPCVRGNPELRPSPRDPRIKLGRVEEAIATPPMRKYRVRQGNLKPARMRPRPETGIVAVRKFRFACDSPLEGNGFELPVPVARLSTVMGDGPAVPRSERICCGTEGSNPSPSSSESGANLTLGDESVESTASRFRSLVRERRLA